MEKHYNFREVENRLYDFWEKQGFFYSDPDPTRKPYTIVIPPPNVTGVLHMGHMLNNTLQDVLIRRKRMEGFNACWVPGTDHASIATEAKVVKMLKEKGIEKKDLTREEFLKYAWEWTEKYGGIILKQLRKLGASCDWRRTRFTLEKDLYDSVIKVFCLLYDKGLIYRGKRMINWDPVGQTALSDEEVIYEETRGYLYYVKYPVVGEENKFITIATTRPETILADTAVAVHPEDERYKELVGKKALIPIVNREVPIIADDYIDPEFGTGALKVTPANDINDYEIGQRHNLEIIEILNFDGTLNENALHYQGKDRFVVKKEIVEELKSLGLLEKIEEITHKVGYSERTKAVVEPMLSEQWFVKMKPLAEPALKIVLENQVRIIPERFKNVYKHWMENIRDWCISRQLWWGHRIPAYYLPDGKIVVAETKELAYEKAKKLGFQGTIDELKQDEDVLDTWFSSWLWPITVFNGILEPDNPDFRYYYPTDDLITAPEILFFWVARMIMAGLEFTGKEPFHTVYLHGIVRDKLRRKMSKSLGNSPDPLELIDKYGADGVRMGMLLAAPAGNDLLFDEALCEQGRNFANKIWNALRLVKLLEEKIDKNKTSQDYEKIAVAWMQNKINSLGTELDKELRNYRFSEALKKLYSVIWNDFFSWFLEILKPKHNELLSSEIYEKMLTLFEELMTLLHPFMPFITEEVWQNLRQRKQGESLMITPLKEYSRINIDEKLLQEYEEVKNIISSLRGFLQKYQLKKDTPLLLFAKENATDFFTKYISTISRFIALQEVRFTNDFPQKTLRFLTRSYEYGVFVEELPIDFASELKKLQKEKTRLEKFLAGIEKKLNNPKFLQNAKPEIVAKEKEKFEGVGKQIKALKDQIRQIQEIL